MVELSTKEELANPEVDQQDSQAAANDQKKTPAQQPFWESYPGKYDSDGFYILEGGDFYDPLGVYFDVEGYDEFGGFYDEQGYYIAPKPVRVDRNGKPLITTSRAKIEAIEGGTYDQDGFYVLKDGSFYDPLGYYFDQDGIDEAGGSYDKEGYYMSPTHFEEELAN